MRTIIVLFFLVVSNCIQAQNNEAQNAIEKFFMAFHAKDTMTLKSLCDKKMILQTISEKEGSAKLENSDPDTFFKSIASIPKGTVFLEKILRYEVQIEGSLAHVWTPYEFYVNGKLSHKGVNSFTLFKDQFAENSNWRIIHLIDTRRK
ncbi:nuclear transport factor 2 family protein [Flavobacterium sp. SOK18b]|uniref:nuclear transport factor 2 family protein n=1 Tax=Flavobacterium sp. SOK18b TaxID=797900 RepID=UPI0015FD21D0|nr:nuclear transport factor 2 family protein [Flavobacterium sp. SOK18b]MBB1193104.1 nuclear transport factor 2 family protein [Flavobacterium sp. SOK18b]